MPSEIKFLSIEDLEKGNLPKYSGLLVFVLFGIYRLCLAEAFGEKSGLFLPEFLNLKKPSLVVRFDPVKEQSFVLN